MVEGGVEIRVLRMMVIVAVARTCGTFDLEIMGIFKRGVVVVLGGIIEPSWVGRRGTGHDTVISLWCVRKMW